MVYWSEIKITLLYFFLSAEVPATFATRTVAISAISAAKSPTTFVALRTASSIARGTYSVEPLFEILFCTQPSRGGGSQNQL